LIHSAYDHEVFKTSDGSHVVIKKQRECPRCHRLFVPDEQRSVFCSIQCYLYDKSSKIPSPEILEKQVWEMPSTQLAKLYDVSDRMIGKWCDKFGISKPPRGYWAKRKHGLV
jgi:ribosomal protein S27AE